MKETAIKAILQQHWVHSHEEDTGTEMIFRPVHFRFPPSRGRKSFELKPDGSLVVTGIGPVDVPVKNPGTWKLEDEDKLIFIYNSENRPTQVMKIVTAEKERLVIRKE
jgi:hypothetical protein